MIYQKLYDFRRQEVKLIRDKKAFNYNYATLDQIQEKISPILEKLNLVVIHSVESQKVVTEIVDLEDGSRIRSEIEIGEVKTITTTDKFDKEGKQVGSVVETNSLDPQGVGSIITYYRRYNLLALLDLSTEDDDGAKGSGRAKFKSEGRQLSDIINDMKGAETVEDLIQFKEEGKAKAVTEKQVAWLQREFIEKKAKLTK